jgi:hypothetical protein
VSWITVPFALMLSLSIAGIGSAWMGGSARIPFVAGLDSYMPSWLGKVHPALRHALRRADRAGHCFGFSVIMNFFGAGVQETFQKASFAGRNAATCSVPLYVRRAHEIRREETVPKASTAAPRCSRRHQRLADNDSRHRAGIFPGAADHVAVWYELWMFGGTLFFIGLAAFFFFVYGRHKAAQPERSSLGRARL